MMKPPPPASVTKPSNFEALHDQFDGALAKFREAQLGRAWPNFLAGHHDVSGRAYENTCPFDRDLLVARLVSADKKAVKAAVFAAREAYPAWAGMAWKQRVRIMRAWATAIDRRKYELAMAALYELGKPRLQAIGEAEEAVDLVRWYCDEVERSGGFVHEMKCARPKKETTSAFRPFGVFAVIAPFNYPIALACNMLAPCLLAGNTTVFKPAPETGLTGALLMETAETAGLPAGVMNMLNGEDAGALLVDAPGVDGIAFTGSHAVGMRIYRKIVSEPFARPVVAAMGGKNPVYVTATADLAVAAEGLVRSAFCLQGEKCSPCSLVYVEKAVAADLLRRLAERTRALTVGSPEDRDVNIGPVIDLAAIERYDRAVKTARAKGRIVCGGEKLKGGDFAKGHFVQPLIVTGLPPDHWINRDELLLPILSVIAVDSLEEGISLGNRSVYGLTAGLYARDAAEITTFSARAEAAVLYVNRSSGTTTGTRPGHRSFCGWKGSGLGRHGVQRYLREQSLTILHS